MRKFPRIAVALLTLIFLVGCDNAMNPAKDDTEPKGVAATGYVVIGGPVSGMLYLTSSGLTGKTGENGSFDYKTGDTITFVLSETVRLPAVAAKKVITASTLGDAIAAEYPLSASVSRASFAVAESDPVALVLVGYAAGVNTRASDFGISVPSPDPVVMGPISSVPLIPSSVLTVTADSYSQTVSDLANISVSEVITLDEALTKMELSDKLADTLETSTGKENFFVTVLFPEGKSGTVSVSYRLEELPEGVEWYTSGTSQPLADDMPSVSFGDTMYEGNWTVNIFQFEDPGKVQAGDIFTFYHADGFKPTLPDGFPLTVADTKVVLQADLSESGAVVETVYDVSGSLIVPKSLPDGTDYKAATGTSTPFIFYDIYNPDGEPDEYGNPVGVGSFDIRLELADTADWTETTNTTPEGTDVACYAIPYSTSLPADFLMSGQLYIGYYAEAIDFAALADAESLEDMPTAAYQAIAFNMFDDVLGADVTGSDFVVDAWEEVSSF